MAAGMDDFVSKPIDAEGFLRVVSRFMAVELWRDDAEAPSAESGMLDAVELDSARLDAFAGMLSSAKLAQVLNAFLDGMAARLQRIEELALQVDFAAMSREAHDLKGVCANLGVLRLRALAEQLERASQSQDDAEVPRLIGEIRPAAAAAREAIAGWMARRDLAAA